MSAGTRVLITPRSLTSQGLDLSPELAPLRERGYQLVGPPGGQVPSANDLAALLPGCVAWLAGVERIDESTLAGASGLRVISRNGAGVDSIDLDAASRAGVTVVRATGANAEGVAELALTVLLTALRHLPASTASLREGLWSRSKGSELAERTVGVVGLGAIGARVAEMLGALGARVVGHDPYVTNPAIEIVELDRLLDISDVVSLHCPPAPDGRPLIDATRLARLPHGTVLINTARSSLVDDDAVLVALESGALSYYAIDAFDTEPPEPSALLQHPRVIATPHLGGFTTTSVRRATSMAVDNILRELDRP